jgi:uncharacterized protein YcbX
VAIIGRLFIHPIKALPPVRVPEVRVLASGALEGDRRFALLDAEGRFVNGKHTPSIHLLRPTYDLAAGEVTFDGRTFSLAADGDAIAAWCGNRLGQPITWSEDREVGFPDDLVSPGPTFVGSASIAVVASWFGFDAPATRLRFRTNIEVDGVEAFWEDRLYGSPVRMGAVTLDAVNPCARCIVPSRDAVTGESLSGFQKRFSEMRRATLLADAVSAPFDHFYRFTVNTRVLPAEAGKTIRIGDPVS